MDHLELAIAGAGFAGLSCARAAAARGVQTIVIDRKRAPDEAIHTTGLLVKEVADAWDIPRRLTRKIHAVRLYAPDLRFVDLISPGYYFLASDTPGLLRWLAYEARAAGATIRYEASFQGIRQADQRLLLKGLDLSCDFLVGADGARSAVAQHCGLGRNRHFLLGIEAEFQGVRGIGDDHLHVFLDSQLARGYIGWVIPGKGITQIGLAAKRPFTPRLDAFLAKIAGLFDLSRSVEVGRRGGLIPCGGTVQPLAASRVVLIGDSAGMVSPLTAGGIHPAMDVGRAAGVALSDYLLEGGRHPAHALRELAPRFAWKRLLRQGFDLGPPNWLLNTLLANSLVRRLAQTIFFHHRGLFSFDAWRDLVRREPRLSQTVER